MGYKAITTLAKPMQFLEFLDRMITAGIEEDEAEVSEADRAKGVVQIATIHKAKGLEFPIVLIAYADLPLVRKYTSPKIIFEIGDYIELAFHPEWFRREGHVDYDYPMASERSIALALEEELRIFYVACTRSQHTLLLSCRGNLEDVRDDENSSWAKWVLELSKYAK